MSTIIINALQYSKNGAGISKYTQKLCEYMNDNVDVIIQSNVENKFPSKNHTIEIKSTINGSKDRILEEQIKNLKVFKNYKLVHFPDYAIPVLYKGKRIATIHDMAMHTMEDKYTKKQVFTKQMLMKYTIKNADKLICISEFTKGELKKYYPNVDDSKIEVIYNGFEYEEKEYSENQINKVLNKFNIDTEYLLYVGTISPHKNIVRLIEAYSKINNKYNNYKLVIAGKKGWMYEEILQKSRSLGIDDKVIFTDYITDEELDILYKNAKVFTFPSLYEGFGFPPIEAMARKIPVVCSKEGALKEVVADAALICDAYNVDDISEKIELAIFDQELRKELINKGIQRSKYFSWEKTAEQTYKVYERTLRGE